VNDTFLQMIRLKVKGFCCSQIILTLALEAQGKTNADLVRSMGGLCFGINAGEVCGALSGGACMISLYAGKGSNEETPHDRYILMVDELVNWFKGMADSEYGGTRCDDIVERFPDRGICSRIVADTYEKCMDILVKHGFDPAGNAQ
jgi:C_GCAxxG_C_C family probable redox protein